MCFTPSPASLQLKNFLADRHLHTPIDHHNLVQAGVSDVALHHLGVHTVFVLMAFLFYDMQTYDILCRKATDGLCFVL